MDENKKTMDEQAANDAVENASVSDMPEIKKESVVVQKAAAEKWGGSAVTRKFMILALALAILINAGVTAGVMALSARHNGHDKFAMDRGGRPGSEMFLNNRPDGKGQMTAPQDGQNNNGQPTPPADAQNNTQDQSANEAEKAS